MNRNDALRDLDISVIHLHKMLQKFENQITLDDGDTAVGAL